jgi:hypothetical protein
MRAAWLQVGSGPTFTKRASDLPAARQPNQETRTQWQKSHFLDFFKKKRLFAIVFLLRKNRKTFLITRLAQPLLL